MITGLGEFPPSYKLIHPFELKLNGLRRQTVKLERKKYYLNIEL